MKVKDLKIGVVMALTLVFMGSPIVKASAAQATSDNTTLNINQTQTGTEDGTKTEDLTKDDYFWDGEYDSTEDEDLTDYFTEDRDFTADQSQFEITYDDKEYINFLKDKFKEKLGTENKFKTVYEDQYVKEEVNPATTEVRTTNMETKEVVDSYNYFETLDERVMNEEESVKFLEEQMKEAKEDFQEKYGTENEFKKISEDANTIEEVNGYTGEYRTTDKRTRSVTDVYNYFDEMKEEYESIDERF